MIEAIVLLLLLFATVTGAAGIILMKMGAEKLELNLRKLLTNGKLILGIAFFALSTLFFIASLHYGELHINYALTGMTYVWLLILSKKYLSENITRTKLLGTALIILGIILLNL